MQQEFLKLLNDYKDNPARTLVEWQRQINHILNNLTNGDYVTTSAVNVLLTDFADHYPTNNAEAAFALLGSIVLANALTASKLLATNADGELVSVADLASWIAGTTNQVTITNDGDGTITISLPQNIDTSADVEFDSVKLDDLTASRMVAADANKKLVSIAALSAWIAGTTNRITITDDGDGSITISTPQDLHTGASVTFANVTGTTLVKGATGQFGNVAGGNYSEFESDGTYRAVGDATTFDDLQGSALTVQVQGTGVSYNATENTADFTTLANLSDYLFGNYQVRHAWKAGSVVYPHIHWEQAENNTPNWLIRYRWQRQGQAKTTAWTDYKCNTNVFTYVSGTLDQISYGAGITPPVGYSLSDIIQLRIFRDNADTSTVFGGADPYTATVGVTFIDIHIEDDTNGSRTQYSK